MLKHLAVMGKITWICQIVVKYIQLSMAYLRSYIIGRKAFEFSLTL